jgi:A/G-specific adenine glycosylase
MNTIKKSSFSQQLLHWYDQRGRHDLPWRHDISPYRVWVSEIMLQQTQVSTTIPYFNRFMIEFPSIAALATADLNHVLHLWSGLGYYARARNLHKAAKIIHQQYNGKFPDVHLEVQQLPGIGRSTASAILAIAFNQPCAILDGNVKRVLSRLYAVSGWPGKTAVADTLWTYSEQLLPKQRCDDYTQALMDLGATICTPKDPQCQLCPVQLHCLAWQHQTVTLYPTPKPRKTIPKRHVTWIVITSKTKKAEAEQQILLVLRPASGIWGHLWCLPELENTASPKPAVKQLLGIEIDVGKTLPTFTHTFTHFQLHITPVMATVRKNADKMKTEQPTRWYNPNTNEKIGLAAPIQKLLNTLLKAELTDD